MIRCHKEQGMDDPFTVVALGDVAWDVVCKIEHENLVWGSDVPGKTELLPGGSAANFSVWAARLGARSCLWGKVGNDWLGRRMLDHLREKGVECRITVVSEARTTKIGVFIRNDGERAFLMDKDVRIHFTPEDVSTDLLPGASLFFFTGYTLFTRDSLSFVKRVLQEVRSRQIPIAFDPASFHLIQGYGPFRLMEEVGKVDFLLLNENEAQTLLPGKSPCELLRWANVVILKRGGEGATVFGLEKEISAPGVPTHVLDTTGAGDAFDACFLVNYLHGESAQNSLERANALGAYVVARLGAQPDWEQTTFS